MSSLIYHRDIPNESHSRLTTDSFCSFSEGVWQTNVFPVNQHRTLDFITFALNFPDKTNWKFCLWDLTWLLCMDDGLGYELTLQMLCKQLPSLGMFYQFWKLPRVEECLSVYLSAYLLVFPTKTHTYTYCILNVIYSSSWLIMRLGWIRFIVNWYDHFKFLLVKKCLWKKGPYSKV